VIFPSNIYSISFKDATTTTHIQILSTIACTNYHLYFWLPSYKNLY